MNVNKSFLRTVPLVLLVTAGAGCSSDNEAAPTDAPADAPAPTTTTSIPSDVAAQRGCILAGSLKSSAGEHAFTDLAGTTESLGQFFFVDGDVTLRVFAPTQAEVSTGSVVAKVGSLDLTSRSDTTFSPYRQSTQPPMSGHSIQAPMSGGSGEASFVGHYACLDS